MISALFFTGFLIFSLCFAAWKGGAPERLAAAIYFAGAAASLLVAQGETPGRGFRDVATPLLIVDLSLGVGLTLLAVGANRLWLIGASAAQWVAVLAHVVRAVEPKIIPTSYAFLTVIWSWPMVVLLLAGTIAHRRRLVAAVLVPDWRPFSRRPD